MSALTDNQVRALLKKAGPGPWDVDGPVWNRTVWRSSENRICFMAHSNGLDDARDIATSNLVAAAPDLARALLEARAEVARLQAAGLAAVNSLSETAVQNLRLMEENARLRADAQAAVALALEKAAGVCRLAAEADLEYAGKYPDEARKYEDRAHRASTLAVAIRNLAPVDGLAMVEALRKERDDAAERLQGTSLLADEYQDDRDRLAAAQAQIEALRGAAQMLAWFHKKGLAQDATEAWSALDAALASLPVPNFSAGWPLEEGDGSIIVGAALPAEEGE